jgi:hypothetical protein
MFKKDLSEKLKTIFGFSKVTFDAPSDAFEQDTLFIEISECRSRASQGKAYAKVFGSVIVFSQENKLPFGFFNKRIEKAEHRLTKDLFFFNVDVTNEASPATLVNISERRASFVYFYNAQYDPALGELTTLEEV